MLLLSEQDCEDWEVDTVSVTIGDLGGRVCDRLEKWVRDWSSPASRRDVNRPIRSP